MTLPSQFVGTFLDSDSHLMTTVATSLARRNLCLASSSFFFFFTLAGSPLLQAPVELANPMK